MSAPQDRDDLRVTASSVVLLVAGVLVLMVLGTGALVVTLPRIVAGEIHRPEIGDALKPFIALNAALWALVVGFAASLRRPIPSLLQKAVGGMLGIAAIAAYFNMGNLGYPKFYHRWEQFHQYVGARYVKELGYDNLYRCAVVAQDELGTVTHVDDDGKSHTLDLSAEARDPKKTIRDVTGDNLLIPASTALDHPEVCKDRFSPERWEKFKRDVEFFRVQSDKSYWSDMQRDSGFTMPPVWVVAARFFAELHPASVGYQQFLGSLDILYLCAMFAALWWAFGWRVSAAGMVVWGCQASAPFYWTGGSFLRQDWLFFLVLSFCLAKKRRDRLAGAALVYAALLRFFPAFVLLGVLAFIVVGAVRRRAILPRHRQWLLGAAIGAAVLLPLGAVAAGPSAYASYWQRAKVVESVALTNHMGLRPAIAHDFGGGYGSGRMEFARDSSLSDPFANWKRLRNEHYEERAPVAWAIDLLACAIFAAVIWRLRTTWIAGCLAQIFIMLFAQLTCQSYVFVVLGAPLTRARRGLEFVLFSFAALTQIVMQKLVYNDDKYATLSVITIVTGLILLLAFVRWSSPRRAQKKRRKKKRPKNAPAPVEV